MATAADSYCIRRAVRKLRSDGGSKFNGFEKGDTGIGHDDDNDDDD